MSETGPDTERPCQSGMSVLPSGADIIRPLRHVRKVPGADSSKGLPQHVDLGILEVASENCAQEGWI
jgi:hypothetical protein